VRAGDRSLEVPREILDMIRRMRLIVTRSPNC
jgi:hypothetical protein